MLYSDHASAQTMRQIEKFQEKGHHDLQDYVIHTYPSQADRLGKLLLRLPALRLLSPAVMEELFFAGLIGNVQIDSIIPYILRMETAEYNSQMGGPGGLAFGAPSSPRSPMSSTTSSPSPPVSYVGSGTLSTMTTAVSEHQSQQSISQPVFATPVIAMATTKQDISSSAAGQVPTPLITVAPMVEGDAPVASSDIIAVTQ